VFTEFTRRDFFKKAGVLSAALALSGCGGNRAEERLVPFLRSPEEEVAGVFTDYASLCRQCPAGCGILVRTMGGRAHKIEGNPRHPLNQGKLCARGQAGLQALYNPDRLAGPQARTGGRDSAFGTITWDEGVSRLTEALQTAKEASASGSPRVAVLAGQLPDHLYRVAALLLGAASTEVASGVQGETSRALPVVWNLHRAMDGVGRLGRVTQGILGESGTPSDPSPPPLFDLGAADVAVSFGADLFGTWLSPVYFGRAYGEMRRGGGTRRGYLAHVDSRLTATGVSADEWLAVPSGREAEVALVLGRVILDEGLASTPGLPGADAVFTGVDARALAADLGLSFEALVRLARLFGSAAAPLALPGGGLGAHENGLAAVQAVMALNLLVGAHGRTLLPSPTLAGSDFGLAETVSEFSVVRTLVDDLGGGRIDVLLVLDGDPLHDLPAALRFREAAARAPLIVDFSPFPTETGETLADLRLPAPTYLETWGYQVPQPGTRLATLGAQQPVVRQLHDTRSTVDVLLAAAKGLGGAAVEALPWDTEVDYLKASVDGLRDRTEASIVTGDPEVFWVKWQQFGGWWSTVEEPASETPVTAPGPVELAAPAGAADATEGTFWLRPYPSLTLGDGRHANQSWLQETADPMTSVMWDSWVEINPEVAEEMGIDTGDMVMVTSSVGSVEVPAYVYRGIGRDMVAVPLGQGHVSYGRYAAGRGANVAAILEMTQAADGELAWGATRVSLEKTGRAKNLATLEGSDSTVVPEGL